MGCNCSTEEKTSSKSILQAPKVAADGKAVHPNEPLSNSTTQVETYATERSEINAEPLPSAGIQDKVPSARGQEEIKEKTEEAQAEAPKLGVVDVIASEPGNVNYSAIRGRTTSIMDNCSSGYVAIDKLSESPAPAEDPAAPHLNAKKDNGIYSMVNEAPVESDALDVIRENYFKIKEIGVVSGSHQKALNEGIFDIYDFISKGKPALHNTPKLERALMPTLSDQASPSTPTPARVPILSPLPATTSACTVEASPAPEKLAPHYRKLLPERSDNAGSIVFQRPYSVNLYNSMREICEAKNVFVGLRSDADAVLGMLVEHSCAMPDASVRFIDPTFPPCTLAVGKLRLPISTKWAATEARSAGDEGAGNSPTRARAQRFALFQKDGSVVPTDVVQGRLTDRWILSALSACAEDEACIKRLFAPVDKAHTGAALQRAEGALGAYRVTLLFNNWWTNLVVDDFFAVMPSSLTPVFAFGSTSATGFFSTWPMFIEKAFAKLFGSYGALEGQPRISNALMDITGQPFYRIHLQRESPGCEREDLMSISTDAFDRLHSSFKNGHLIVMESMAINDNKYIRSNKFQKQLELVGLISTHYYTVIDVKYFPHVVFEGHPLRLLCLRSSFTKEQWRGDWSNGSPLWQDAAYQQVAEECDYAAMKSLTDVKSRGVPFWIEWKDLLTYFLYATTSITDIRNLRHSWLDYRVKKTDSTFHFVLTVIKRTTFVIIHSQKDVRDQRQKEYEYIGIKLENSRHGARFASSEDPYTLIDSECTAARREVFTLITCDPEDGPTKVYPIGPDEGVIGLLADAPVGIHNWRCEFFRSYEQAPVEAEYQVRLPSGFISGSKGTELY